MNDTTKTEVAAAPAGVKPVESLVKAFDAAAETDAVQGSMIAQVRQYLNEHGTGEKALFAVAQSFAVACAHWDIAHPATEFANDPSGKPGVARNKAKTRALHMPLGYLNREVIRPLGHEIKGVKGQKGAYGLKAYTAPEALKGAAKAAKAREALAKALKALSVNKTNRAAVAKMVAAWENQAA